LADVRIGGRLQNHQAVFAADGGVFLTRNQKLKNSLPAIAENL